MEIINFFVVGDGAGKDNLFLDTQPGSHHAKTCFLGSRSHDNESGIDVLHCGKKVFQPFVIAQDTDKQHYGKRAILPDTMCVFPNLIGCFEFFDSDTEGHHNTLVLISL